MMETNVDGEHLMPRTWLVRLRKQRNLTQTQLAATLKISRSYYASLERGERQGRWDIAHRVAEYFGVPEAWFFDGPDGPEREHHG